MEIEYELRGADPLSFRLSSLPSAAAEALVQELVMNSTTTHATEPSTLLPETQSVLSAQGQPAPAPFSHRRRLSLAAAIAAVAATVATLTVVQGGATPAFAVEKQSDGSVTVRINSFRDAAGLQSALIAAGVPADVVYTPTGKACRQPRYTPADSSVLGSSTISQTAQDGPVDFTIRNGQLLSGQTLVIESSTDSRGTALNMSVAQGDVTACTLVEATQPPFPTGLTSTTP